MSAENDNVQAAWHSAINRCDWRLLDQALQALYRFYYIRSRYGEGKEQFAYALQQLSQTTSAAEKGDQQFLQRLQARLGSFCLALGELDAAEATFAAVLQDSIEASELAFVYAQLGEAARWRGNRQAAQEALEKSLNQAHASGDQNRMAKAFLGLADVASAFSDFAAGEGYAREALALCRPLQRPDLTARVVASLAWAVNSQGAYAESAHYYHESLTIAESIGNSFSIGVAIQFLGWVAYCEGGARLAEALAQYERAIAIFRQIGHKNHLAMTLGDYALAASECGHHTAALRAAQEGLALAQASGQRTMVAYNLNGMGAATCALHDVAASRRYLHEALQITSISQMDDHSMVALYWLAQLHLNESQTASSAAQRLEIQLQALELLSLVAHNPATWQLFRDRAQRAQAELAVMLPAELAAAAIARGQDRSPAEVFTALLQDGMTN
ncbi:MAG: hypothetical protein R2932_43260 [Caldilineaceae bacterium]